MKIWIKDLRVGNVGDRLEVWGALVGRQTVLATGKLLDLDLFVLDCEVWLILVRGGS